MTVLLIVAVLLVAFVNGANDNMKGVATVYGSGVLDYRRSLLLATVSTALGAVASVSLASGLARAFSGKGLVPDAALSTAFLAAVAVAAGLTVLLATWRGFPVSTTHALIGGLLGAGLVVAGRELNLTALLAGFLLPLLLSPLLAIGLAFAAYKSGCEVQGRLKIEHASCVCIGEEWVAIGGPGAAAIDRQMTAAVGTTAECRTRYVGRVVGIPAQSLVTGGHLLSAGLVGFSRGLNDTPKILGLVLGVGAVSPTSSALAIALAMALGGLLAARRVAETMGHGITPMTAGQGLAANVVTSFLVAGASRMGLPVSTTHVSVGGIFGIGAPKRELRRHAVAAILAAWVTTLPVAAVLGASVMWLLA